MSAPAQRESRVPAFGVDELVRQLAEAIAVRVADQLRDPQGNADLPSPWLDFAAAMAYTGFSRDRLYKLTAAKAIPHRKKRDGQGLLFHRDELDAWISENYPRQDLPAPRQS